MVDHVIATARGRLSVLTAALMLAAAPTFGVAATPDPVVSPAQNAGERTQLHFRSVGTFDVMAGNGSAVAEIVDASADGRELVYTDSANQAIGFVDISFPRQPKGTGTLAVGGEPTSLVVFKSLVLVGVNTSAGAFSSPSGKLVVVNRKTRQIVTEFVLGGQPDSLALAPDGKRAVIVLENERDEDVNDGLIPQEPTGALLIVDLQGAPTQWQVRAADLSPVAAHADNGGDLEPEYVDVNSRNEAVVSFQENNHLAIVDIVTGNTVTDFPAGSAALNNVDTAEEDLITLNSSLNKRREPDGVAWIDDDSFATANEGDYEDASGEQGGSRGFTVFNRNGTVEFESAESFEHGLVRAGHYNEGRSENKGVEPESVEFGRFGDQKLLFVGSERSNAVGVYDVGSGNPEALQVLPTGIGPEGLKAIPKRGLFVSSTETDVADIGIPTMITLYKRFPGQPLYPAIESGDDVNGLPIPWVALSGLVGDPSQPHILYGVSDAFLASGFIYSIDVSKSPARIVSRLEVTGATHASLDRLDLEGIAIGPDGHFWVASEGAGATGRPNLVLKVNASTGVVVAEIELPAGLAALRRSNGFEGIAVTGTAGAETVYVAIQRAWPAAGDTDKVNTRIGRYDVATGTWGFVHYPLQPQGNGDWIGLSELSLLPNGSFAVIERDKGWGPSTGFVAELKALYGVNLADAEFRPFDDARGLVTVEKNLLKDLLPLMARRSIWTAEKLEGLGVAADRKLYVVTDNDGVDDATGETLFLRLGSADRL